jgi:hypothetical protein
MEPITEDQFLTLRRWAITVQQRPGRRMKKFLLLEKGLTEEQIDRWWDDAMVKISNASGPSRKKTSHFRLFKF